LTTTGGRPAFLSFLLLKKLSKNSKITKFKINKIIKIKVSIENSLLRARRCLLALTEAAARVKSFSIIQIIENWNNIRIVLL
jgi:hypothetical protein